MAMLNNQMVPHVYWAAAYWWRDPSTLQKTVDSCRPGNSSIRWAIHDCWVESSWWIFAGSLGPRFGRQARTKDTLSVLSAWISWHPWSPWPRPNQTPGWLFFIPMITCSGLRCSHILQGWSGRKMTVSSFYIVVGGATWVDPVDPAA